MTTVPGSRRIVHQRAQHHRAKGIPGHVGPGLDGYLDWFYDVAVVRSMSCLSRPEASTSTRLAIVAPYARSVLDEVLRP